MQKIISNGVELEATETTAALFQHFSNKADTAFLPDAFIDVMVKAFCLTYVKDISSYYSDDKTSRSNWTHHTANTFLRTCQLFDLLCDFEVENRLDGAIRDASGNVYLAAEWEYDTNSIFKEKGEIFKLYQTCKKHKRAEAMLFTYKVDTDYVAFADKVFSTWNSMLGSEESFRLFLLTAIMQKQDDSSVRLFSGIRTVVFGNGTVDIWEDY